MEWGRGGLMGWRWGGSHAASSEAAPQYGVDLCLYGRGGAGALSLLHCQLKIKLCLESP